MTVGLASVVVFDLDGVLCRYDRACRLEILASLSGLEPAEVHDAIWGSGLEDLGERGALGPDDYLKGFGERLGYPISLAEWIEARRRAIEPNLEVLLWARRLAAVVPVGMLTNNPLLLKRHFGEVYPAAHELFGERAVFSAELGCCKPEPQVFLRLADRFGCRCEEVVFFDDDPSYVAGARDVGVRAHLVRSVDDVRVGLAAEGIEFDSEA